MAHKNPFLADPRDLYYGGAAGGTDDFPGFHTADLMSVAAPYAQVKITGTDNNDGNTKIEKLRICDYPVILEMDMRGLRAVADHDAVMYTGDSIETIASEALAMGGKDLVENIRNLLLEGVVEDGYMSEEEAHEGEFPDDAYEALFYLSTHRIQDPHYGLIDMLEGKSQPEIRKILTSIVKGKSTYDAHLSKAIGQFRYTQDISEERLLAVHYMTPFWDDVFEPSELWGEKTTRKAGRIEAAGWVVLSKDMEEVPLETTEVWRNQKQRYFPWLKNRRTEYHGTSYRNLLLAVPWLREMLPVPPRPYEPCGDEAR